MLKVYIGARGPFSFERLHREEKGMNHVVKTVVFMGKTVLFIFALICAAWLAITIHFSVAYGPLEAVTFALGSLALISLIYGMIHHGKP